MRKVDWMEEIKEELVQKFHIEGHQGCAAGSFIHRIREHSYGRRLLKTGKVAR